MTAMHQRAHDWLDGAAVGISWLCLAHCLLLPVAFALLPVLADVLAMPEWLHVAMLALALPVSIAALTPRAGRRRPVWTTVTACAGFAGLTIGLAGHSGSWQSVVPTVIGSTLLVALHLANWRLRRASAAACAPRKGWL